jgi:uncharacterized protein YoxC
MKSFVLIFLAIAVIIIAMAFLVSWIFGKKIKHDKHIQKKHERGDDGLSSGVGTGIGIDKTDGDF